VLLDLNLPGATGLSCLSELRRVVPTTPIVVVSAVGDPKIMQDVIMGGAGACHGHLSQTRRDQSRAGHLLPRIRSRHGV
jgi:DNA-binding NarL/FixJ family response regulator